MQLPDSLKQALEEISKQTSCSLLKEGYQELSSAYRLGKNSSSSFQKPNALLAYLFARMPATFAAVYQALESVKERLKNISFKSLTDFGAGPGTASWAAAELFPSLSSITLFEENKNMLALGQKLASHSDKDNLKNSRWIQQNLLQEPFPLPQADLAIFSYIYSEVNCEKLIVQSLQSGATVLIVEPGTPQGFERIKILRSALLKLGAHLIAPCPHSFSCPAPAWCHFPARVERTKIHKLLKEGSLGYEDEKYCYLAFSSHPCPSTQDRIVDHPQKRPGHIQLTLCTREGNWEQKIITKKQKETYHKAKKLSWSSLI